MRLERACCGAAGIVHQHRSLYLHEIARREEAPDLPDDLGALHQHPLRVLIHNEIHIALAVSGIRILKSVKLLRQRIKRLREQSDLLRMNGDLPHLRHKDVTLYPHDVPEIELLKAPVLLLAKGISRHIGLDSALPVLDVHEARLPHHTLRHDAPCN